MFRAISLILAAAVLFLIAGCVTSQSMAIGPTTYPPRPKDYVITVYIGTDAPVFVHRSIANPRAISDIPSGATEIGRVDAKGAPAASWGSVIADAMTRARALGGDGLVIGQWGNPTLGIDQYGNLRRGKAISMTVIRYNP